MDDATLERLADLAVGFGANVQPGQIVSVRCEPGKEALTRAIVRAAYQRGAKFVDVTWFDPLVKRERIAHAAEDTLEFVPRWYGERLLALAEERGALITLAGPSVPGALDGLSPARAGRDRLPALKESGKVVGERLLNWTILPGPTLPWARLVHPDLPDPEALERLEGALLHVLRLDEPDPVAAWQGRVERLEAIAAALTERRYDALHYAGPGIDLTVGLLAEVRWQAARFSTADGIPHMPNLPTEEVFTSPDPERVDGEVTSSKPLVLNDGTVVRDLRVRFEGGRAVDVQAGSGQEVMRTIVARDEGAPRLGEVALVDAEGRVGALDTIFYDTLLDENAASHIALGEGFAFLAGDDATRARLNNSQIHIDFMIGSPELTVTGVRADGSREVVLAGGRWGL